MAEADTLSGRWAYIDKNRAVKPFVIGRKAWLFANTTSDAKVSTTLYSLVETAKINGLEQYDYLTTLFKELPTADTPDKLTKLLPFRFKQQSRLGGCGCCNAYKVPNVNVPRILDTSSTYAIKYADIKPTVATVCVQF